jgi:abortive infection bacteriophage resistance protein
MKYLRDEKKINIYGSTHKKKLMNIGYYHGYKGYRYIRKTNNQVNYSNFDELLAVYEFDSKLKSLFYPYVMKIETALKSHVLEDMVSSIHSDSFIDAYSLLLDNYKDFSTTGKKFKSLDDRKKMQERFQRELKKRLELRSRIYKIQSDAYAHDNHIASHFLSKDINLPLWAIFELLTLGEFGHLISCLNYKCRKTISINLGINQSDDTNALLPQRIVYAVKDLRNAIAHNDVIFDTRFKTGHIDKQVSNAITNRMSVKNVNFSTITDYLILLVYILDLIGESKTEIKHLIKEYSDIINKLYTQIPNSVFHQIMNTDYHQKINNLIKNI